MKALADLLTTAEQGTPDRPKATSKDRKVAGRTRATAATTWPRPELSSSEPAPGVEDDQESDDGLAPVIPLPVFDVREEANKRWW